jgi:hypothetical protein
MMFSAMWLLPSMLAMAYAYLKLAMCQIKNEEFLLATLSIFGLILTAIVAISLIGAMATFASTLLGIAWLCFWHAMAFFMIWSAEKEYEKTFNKPSTVFSFIGRVHDVTKRAPQNLRGRVARFRQQKQDVVIIPDGVATAS